MIRRNFIAGVLFVAACGSEDPPASGLVGPPDIETTIVYESERIRAFTRPGMVFCRGDGARMDSHIERLSALFEMDPPPQLPVYVMGNDDAQVIEKWCFGSLVDGTTLGGCFRPWMVVMQGRWWSHELNHAVLHVLNPEGALSDFWSEAYASAWETKESTGDYFDSLHGQDVAGAGTEGQDLLRWLKEVHGIGPVRDFYVSGSHWERADIDAAFEDAFGITYEQAIEQYEAEVPPIYPGFGWCEGAEVIDVPLGETHMTLHVDCDAPDTHTFAYYSIDGMYVRRILRLAQPAELVIEYTPDTGILKHHPCLETPVESEDDPRLSKSAWSEFNGTSVPGGSMTWPFDVPAGDSLFEFVVPFGSPVTVEAIIHAEPIQRPP